MRDTLVAAGIDSVPVIFILIHSLCVLLSPMVRDRNCAAPLKLSQRLGSLANWRVSYVPFYRKTKLTSRPYRI